MAKIAEEDYPTHKEILESPIKGKIAEIRKMEKGFLEQLEIFRSDYATTMKELQEMMNKDYWIRESKLITIFQRILQISDSIQQIKTQMIKMEQESRREMESIVDSDYRPALFIEQELLEKDEEIERLEKENEQLKKQTADMAKVNEYLELTKKEAEEKLKETKKRISIHNHKSWRIGELKKERDMSAEEKEICVEKIKQYFNSLEPILED